MKPPFSYVPLLPVLASLAAGVLLYHLTDSLAIPILIGFLGTVAILFRRRYIATLICTAAAGWCVAALNDAPTVPPVCQQSNVTYTAIAQDGRDTDAGYEINGKILGFVSPVDSALHSVASIAVKLSIPAVNLSISNGDTITFKGEYMEVRSNPDLPDEFNPAFHSNPKVVKFRVRETDLILGGNKGGLLQSLRKFREYLGDAIITSGVNEECTNFLLASLLGEGRWISRDERDLYSRSGMAHILALSGAHVGLILAMLTLALLPLSVTRHNKTRSIITILLLWCYVVMTGGSPSVTRAVIMVTLLLGGLMLRRPHSGMNSLCAAAMLIILFNPNALFQPGFQLSFMAVASISLLANEFNPAENTPLFRPMQWVILPLTATAGTYAIIIYHFHIFPVYFLIFAPIATLLLTMVMMGGIFLIITTLTGIPHALLSSATNYLFDIVHNYLGVADTLPENVIENLYISLPTTVILSLLPFALAAFIKYRKKWIAVGWICAASICLLSEYIFSTPYPEQEIFITDHPYTLCIATKTGNQITLLTTADDVQKPILSKEFTTSHSAYLSKRNIAEVKILTDTSNTADCKLSGRIAMLNGITFLILKDAKDIYPPPYPIQYLVVSDGFRGNILEAVTTICPSNILLTRDLNTKLRTRYFQELTDAGYSPIDLSDTGTLLIEPVSQKI